MVSYKIEQAKSYEKYLRSKGQELEISENKEILDIMENLIVDVENLNNEYNEELSLLSALNISCIMNKTIRIDILKEYRDGLMFQLYNAFNKEDNLLEDNLLEDNIEYSECQFCIQKYISDDTKRTFRDILCKLKHINYIMDKL